MKLTKSQLRQMIEEELKKLPEVYETGDIDLYGDDPSEKYDAPVYKINDQLVTVASKAVREVVHLLIARSLPREKVKDFVDNVELDIEEPLMDALLPIAQQIIEIDKNRAEAVPPTWLSARLDTNK